MSYLMQADKQCACVDGIKETEWGARALTSTRTHTYMDMHKKKKKKIPPIWQAESPHCARFNARFSQKAIPFS